MAVSVSLFAAELHVYRDGAQYRFEPESKFLGFISKGAKATCQGVEIALRYKDVCPQNSTLCRLRSSIKELEKEAAVAKDESEILREFVQNSELTKVDFKAWIENAAKIADRIGDLAQKSEAKSAEARRKREVFGSMSTSFDAAYLDSLCNSEISLQIPKGWVTFDVEYIADISKPPKISILQRLKVKNRSGLDISAERALFTYESMRKYLRPFRFQPWVVGDRGIVPKGVQMRLKKVERDSALSAMAAPAELSVEVKSPRKYLVRDLYLPSSGKQINLALKSWEQKAIFEKRVYTWRDTRVYDVLLFKPKYAIDVDRWSIVRKEEVAAKGVTGAYIGGRYTLFANIDEDFVVHKDKLILKDRVTFFGGTVKERSGYAIEVVNQSAKRADLIIVERIPVAKREDVEVKLLEVSSKQPIEYKLSDQGRLDIRVSLAPGQSSKVRVVFEIAHDKDRPVIY